MKVRAYIKNPKYGQEGQPEFLQVPFRGDPLTSIEARLTAVETNKANASDVVTGEELTAKNYVNLDYVTTELAKKQDSGDYVTSAQLTSATTEMLTQDTADGRYQFKGNYITQSDADMLYQPKGESSGLTKTEADEYYQPKGEYALSSDIPDISNKADKVSIVDGGTGAVTATIEPNTFYTYATPTSLNITLSTPTDSGHLNIYAFQFTTGTSVPTLTVNGVTWAGGSAPYLEASKTYQVTILNGLAAIGGG